MAERLSRLEAGCPKEGVIHLALLYHDVIAPGRESESGFPGADADKYKLPIPQFEAHLDAVAAAGARGVAPAEVRGRGEVVFTFDDGGASGLDIAARLERRGWLGVFFITTDRLGEPGFLTDEGVAELHRRGHVVGSHSASHPLIMSDLSDADLDREWRGSRERLDAICGAPTLTASIPGGYYSDRVAAAAARAGIETLYTSEPVANGWEVGGCHLLGRFNVDVGSSASEVGALAAGRPGPRLRQYVAWNAKKAAKRAGGAHYIRLRKAILAMRGRGAG